MAKTETIIIDYKVNSDDAIKRMIAAEKALSDLKNQQKELQKQLKDGTITENEYADAITGIKTGIIEQTNILKANQKALNDNVKEETAAAGSMNEMKAKLSEMSVAYQNLSAEERKSAGGKELLTKISDTSDELKKLEGEMGNHTRNVGNYVSAFDAFPTPLKKVKNAFMELSSGSGKVKDAFNGAIDVTKNFGKQLLSLMRIPIVAVISAIVGAIMLLIEQFKKNGDAMRSLKSLTASFQPILDVVKEGLTKIIEVLAKIISGIAGFINKIVSLIPAMKKYQETEQDMLATSIALAAQERDFTVQQAKDNATVAKLRVMSKQSDKYSYESRKKYTEMAIALEQEDLRVTKEIALKKLKIAEQQASVNKDTTKETKDQIAQLKAAYYQADAEYFTGTRRLQQQLTTFVNEESTKRQEAAKKAADERKRIRDLEKDSVRAYQDAIINLIQNDFDKQVEQAKLAGEREVEELKKKLSEEKKMTKETRDAIQQTIVLTEANTAIQVARIREQQNQNTIQREYNAQKQILDAKLNLIKQGTEEELNIKKQSLSNDYENEIRALEQRKKNGELTEEELASLKELAQEKYYKNLDTMLKEHDYSVELQQKKMLDDSLRLELLQAGDNARAKAEVELEIAQQKYLELQKLDEENQIKQFESIDAYKAALLQAGQDVKKANQNMQSSWYGTTQTIFGSVDAVGGAFQTLFSNLANSNEKMNKYNMAISYAMIMVKMAEGIASAIAEGMKLGWPAAIAAIPIGIAVVVSGIAQAVQVFQQNKNAGSAPTFSCGGIVEGAGTSTSDSVPTRLSAGESVINAKSTAKYYDLLSAINEAGGGKRFGGALDSLIKIPLHLAGGGMVPPVAMSQSATKASDMDGMKEAMQEAVSEIRPVVSVKEITHVQNRITTKEKIARK